jgi:hypothetical protein
MVDADLDARRHVRARGEVPPDSIEWTANRTSTIPGQ